MLYLVATPIGNLKDITLRAIEVLQHCSIILCEDTRRSRILLDHYKIKTPLRSYHKFSESKQEEEIIQLLKEGREIALISDAGSPAIADPGERLTHRCRQESIAVTVIPGPASPIVALTLSGLSAQHFQWLGFLPKKRSERTQLFLRALYYSGTTLFFESPERLHNTLEEICGMNPTQPVAVARELTKMHEECRVGTAKELLAHYTHEPARGECILLIQGVDDTSKPTLAPHEHVTLLQKSYGLTMQDAIKTVAYLHGLPKQEIYRAVHKDSINC